MGNYIIAPVWLSDILDIVIQLAYKELGTECQGKLVYYRL